MNAPLRLAGRGRWRGDLVTWTISEGRRGRRWREVLTRDGAMLHSLLLETDPAGRFTHLELAVAGVLVTLHPEGDGTLHGNRVDEAGAGVEHIEGLPFPDGSGVLVEGSPLGAAAVRWGHATMGAVIDRAGRVRVGAFPDVAIATDEHGMPRLDDAATWPLER